MINKYNQFSFCVKVHALTSPSGVSMSIELSKRVTRLDSVRPTTDWWFSEPTQPGLLFSEPKKFKPGPTHHGLAG